MENGHKKAEEALLKYKQNMTAGDVEKGERVYMEILERWG